MHRYLPPLKTYFRYDPVRHMASLEDVCISRASAKQRRGRAGRVRAGLCFHLFTSDAPLSEYTQVRYNRFQSIFSQCSV